MRTKITDASTPPRLIGGAVGLLAIVAISLAGCPTTEFYREGPGTASDRASGIAPAGALGACRIPGNRRPPLVNEALWKNLRQCSEKTPRRYLQLGYGRTMDGKFDDDAQARVDRIMRSIQEAAKEKDGNTRMLGMLRDVRRYAANDQRLVARIERAQNRTYPCDYRYLFTTMVKQQETVKTDRCPIYVYDPKLRREHCLFDISVEGTSWLTGAWGCFAFTQTVGEGESCYRKCSYDDYCAAQVNCSAPDFDLVMCALGVCLPEKAKGLY